MDMEFGEDINDEQFFFRNSEAKKSRRVIFKIDKNIYNLSIMRYEYTNYRKIFSVKRSPKHDFS